MWYMTAARCPARRSSASSTPASGSAACRRSRASRSTSWLARCTRWSARTAPARARWCASSPAPSVPTPARSTSSANGSAHADPASLRALGVAPIYQQPALFPDLSVAENIAFGLEPRRPWRRIDWAARRRTARDAARPRRRARSTSTPRPARCGWPNSSSSRSPARSARDARVLLMDEPTAALTDREAAAALCADWRPPRDGVGIVYISHRLDEIDALADRVTHPARRPSVADARRMASSSIAPS